jgi:hypothetical protein
MINPGQPIYTPTFIPPSKTNDRQEPTSTPVGNYRPTDLVDLGDPLFGSALNEPQPGTEKAPVNFNDPQSIQNKMVELGGGELLQYPPNSPESQKAWEDFSQKWTGSDQDLKALAYLRAIHELDAATGNLPPDQNPSAPVREQLVQEAQNYL